MSDYSEHLISMAGGDGEVDVLGEIEARVGAATAGHWYAETMGKHRADVLATHEDGAIVICEHAGEDADFIAHARTDVPTLLAMVREQRAVIERAKAEGWDRGFSAGWAECSDPGAFVNDAWDAETPNPYRAAITEDAS